MLRGLDGAIDVLVPRGGKGLVARVQAEAHVPVFAHLDGNCHIYVDGAAELAMAKTILLNAKMRRTGVCGAAETLLVDRACAATHLAPLVVMLLDAGCEVRGMPTPVNRSAVKPASEADWSTEYLDAIIAAKVVDGVAGAIAYRGSRSHHTDAIVTQDRSAAELSSPTSTRRSSCTTPRRNLPTAASSASGPRSALRPAGCTRAGRSGSNNSRPSSIASTAAGRSDRDM
jgi:glutamate-5-semialdehyde dehydrogenase